MQFFLEIMLLANKIIKQSFIFTNTFSIASELREQKRGREEGEKQQPSHRQLLPNFTEKTKKKEDLILPQSSFCSSISHHQWWLNDPKPRYCLSTSSSFIYITLILRLLHYTLSSKSKLYSSFTFLQTFPKNPQKWSISPIRR